MSVEEFIEQYGKMEMLKLQAQSQEGSFQKSRTSLPDYDKISVQVSCKMRDKFREANIYNAKGTYSAGKTLSDKTF